MQNSHQRWDCTNVTICVSWSPNPYQIIACLKRLSLGYTVITHESLILFKLSVAGCNSVYMYLDPYEIIPICFLKKIECNNHFSILFLFLISSFHLSVGNKKTGEEFHSYCREWWVLYNIPVHKANMYSIPEPLLDCRHFFFWTAKKKISLTFEIVTETNRNNENAIKFLTKFRSKNPMPSPRPNHSRHFLLHSTL